MKKISIFSYPAISSTVEGEINISSVKTKSTQYQRRQDNI